jgi:hypothetical protein
MVTGHMVTMAFGSLGLSGHWSRVSPWLWSLLGHGLGSSQQPMVKPRVKSLSHGQSQANSPGSRPQTRAKPKHPGHGSNHSPMVEPKRPGSRPGLWVKPKHPGLSPGSSPQTRVTGRAQGQAQAPGSRPQTRVTGRAQGQTISPGSRVRV